MKKELQKYSRQRLRFIGTISRFGSRNSPAGKVKQSTVLLLDVHLDRDNEFIAEHVWLRAGRRSKKLRVGDEILFEARVKRYQKGYKGVHLCEKDSQIREDYRLEKPVFVKLIKPANK